MSEKIYALLLRLYPSRFQKAYGEEARLLFRDRAREERGFLPRLRLWLDLFGDLAISLPREYRAAPAALASPAPLRSGGIPSFHVLEDETLSFGAMLYGAIASLLLLGSIVVLINHAGKPLPFSATDFERAPRHSGTIEKPTPAITVSYTPAKPAPGAAITLTATVDAVASGPTPTGHVGFFYGCATLNTATLSDGAVTVKATLPLGPSHSIRAIYYGDMNYSASNSTATQEVKTLKYK